MWWIIGIVAFLIIGVFVAYRFGSVAGTPYDANWGESNEDGISFDDWVMKSGVNHKECTVDDIFSWLRAWEKCEDPKRWKGK